MTTSPLLRNVIGGRPLATLDDARTTLIVDPSTGEAYAEAPVSGPGDLDAAFAAAAGAAPAWRDLTPAMRSRALLRIADAVEARAEDFIAAECRNTGKPCLLYTSPSPRDS